MQQQDRDQPLPRSFWLVRLATLAYVSIGLWFMVAASPKVPYADPYRFLVTFLSLPFPDNALAADNGHRELLPNLVRIAELHWLDANQWLQVGVGVILAIAAALAIISAFCTAARPARVAATACVSIGIFWLGNGRKLAHGNESVHLFLILLSLAIGLRTLSRLQRGGSTAPAWAVAALGVLATLSFGSGVACFPAFFMVLVLQRASWRHWLPVLIGAGIAAAALLGAGEGDSPSVAFAPIEQFLGLLRWLGAPFVWALSPLLDVAHAARVPEPFSTPLVAIATPIEAAFGPHLAARWPATAIGGLGLLWLITSTVRTWCRSDATARERFALGLAWFGCTVGLLVVTARLDYFREHPDQMTSQRYVPWSMMCWTGLMLRFVLRDGRAARTLVGSTIAAALLFAPSQVWTGRYVFNQLDAANLTAVGAAVGVLDREFPLVETEAADLEAAIPLLRAGDKAMFAWPETDWLGKQIGSSPHQVVVREVAVTRISNRLGASGSHVEFLAEDVGCARLLLLDHRGTVQGLAVHTGPGERWQGWLRGHVEAVDLRAAALR